MVCTFSFFVQRFNVLLPSISVRVFRSRVGMLSWWLWCILWLMARADATEGTHQVSIYNCRIVVLRSRKQYHKEHRGWNHKMPCARTASPSQLVFRKDRLEVHLNVPILGVGFLPHTPVSRTSLITQCLEKKVKWVSWSERNLRIGSLFPDLVWMMFRCFGLLSQFLVAFH